MIIDFVDSQCDYPETLLETQLLMVDGIAIARFFHQYRLTCSDPIHKQAEAETCPKCVRMNSIAKKHILRRISNSEDITVLHFTEYKIYMITLEPSKCDSDFRKIIKLL